MIGLATQNSWSNFQLDVKSTFLHSVVQKQVFIDQSPGYVKLGSEHKLYIFFFLKKNTIWVLKQAPRAWYSHIATYFSKEGFQKCPYEIKIL